MYFIISPRRLSKKNRRQHNLRAYVLDLYVHHGNTCQRKMLTVTRPKTSHVTNKYSRGLIPRYCTICALLYNEECHSLCCAVTCQHVPRNTPKNNCNHPPIHVSHTTTETKRTVQVAFCTQSRELRRKQPPDVVGCRACGWVSGCCVVRRTGVDWGAAGG